jgi:hypothetical protein
MSQGNKLLAEQSRRNRESREQWMAFTSHRSRVTALLLQAALGRQRPNLCLLGAGNCNDVDLAQLLVTYEAIHLVDCDSAALTAGVERQQLAGNPSLVLDGGIDLLGLPSEDPAAKPADVVSAVARHPLPKDLGPFDVIASLCLLSQLIDAAVLVAAGAEPLRLELIQAVRRRHLEMMVELLKPEGVGLLITDLVSSETAPRLQTLPDSQVATYVGQCIADRNFFTGLNPAVILELLKREPWFTSRISLCPPVSPWVWNLGPRLYGVYAIQFCRHRRNPDAAGGT